jgi:enterochelin esterase family protein
MQIVVAMAVSMGLLGASLLGAAPGASTGAAATGTAPATATGPGARGGRGGGRGGRGGGMTDEDRAAIAKLGTLPEWKPGVGDGDYMMAPPYAPAPENKVRDEVPKGKVVTFQLPMEGSKFYPPGGGGRGGGAGGGGATREVNVYIPAGYVAGTPAPLLVCHDAMGMHDNQPAPYLPTILDNMIFDKRLPPMIAVMVMPSGNRSGEYDTVSGKYAEYLEEEVLPRVAKDYNVTFSKDPDARGVLGGSSGGAASMSMAWFHPEWYHRVLMFSSTLTSLRPSADAPHGAWEFHENLIPKSEAKPLRIWLEVGQNDNGSTGSGAGMGNWVIANMHMAEVLKAKGYHYQFVYAKEAGHVDRPVRAETLAPALEWLWKDYKPSGK